MNYEHELDADTIEAANNYYCHLFYVTIFLLTSRALHSPARLSRDCPSDYAFHRT